jgi:CDP-diacylglycerol--serine O-phosphatidyltransferase
MKNIPNFITTLNLASGFFAIIAAANGELVKASWLILAAMIFDFLDGLSARLLKAYSDIGKELDSLADIVSFGVAPALIIYELLNDALLKVPIINETDSVKATLILITPVLMPACAAMRLAIFNIDTTQTTSFKGLPTPANALAVISVVIAENYSRTAVFSSFTGSSILLILFTVLLSLMMVSRIPFLSLKLSDLKFKGNEGRYILAISVLVSFALFGINAAPLIIPLYVIASFLSILF